MCKVKCGVYKITSPSNRIYIGQAVNVEKRWRTYKKIDCKSQRRLYNSLLKHGVENHIFEIVELCEIKDLNINERKWQEYYNSTGRQGLNCLLTKTGDKSGKLCEATKKKMSEYWLNAYANGRVHPCTGTTLSKERKDALREVRKNQVITKESRDKAVETRRERGNLQPTDEQRKRMSDAHIGNVVTEETRIKIGLANKGKILSKETKQKLSDANKGRKHSDEMKQKISDANIGNKNRLGKKCPHSEETKLKIGLANKGKIMSEEARKKLSESAKGRVFSDEHRAKLAKAKLGKKRSKYKEKNQ